MPKTIDVKSIIKGWRQLLSDLKVHSEVSQLYPGRSDSWNRLKNARELTRRAMDSAEHNDAKETAAYYQAEAALREVEMGNREQARTDANAAVKLAPNRDVQAMAALALARAGDTAGANKLAAELDKTFPQDTLVQRYWLPTVRAAVAMEHKDAGRALELLKQASALEVGTPTNFNVFLCPVHVRGEAYLAAGDGDRAAGEFQKFIDHRGLVANFPWGALARLRLARACEFNRALARKRRASTSLSVRGHASPLAGRRPMWSFLLLLFGQLRSFLAAISSALRIAAPAAPRIVL